MKIKSLTIFLTCLLLSSLTAPAIACGPPACDPPGCGTCYDCEDGVWVWQCGAGQTCCGGSCCSGICCGGFCSNGTCYNPATQKCCTDLYPPYLCDSNQTCCKGCCDAGKECCTYYLSGFFLSSCCDLSTKCCDYYNGGCVKKCDPEGDYCYFTWPPVGTPSTGCQSCDPTDLSCPKALEGLVCKWVQTEAHHLRSAKCANCAPYCKKGTDYCVELTPWKCNDDWLPSLGFRCSCNNDLGGTPVNLGDYYECK